MTAQLEEAVRVRIPDRPPDAVNGWAKSLSGINPSLRGGYSMKGAYLERGGDYQLPDGLLVVTVDKWESGGTWRLRAALHRVTPDGLQEMKAWTNGRGRIGPQITKGLTAAWKKHRGPVSADSYASAASLLRVNQYPGTCSDCGQTVPVGRGRIVRDGEWHRVRHVGGCPPRPNDHPGMCVLCGGWITARAGIITRRENLGSQPAATGLSADKIREAQQWRWQSRWLIIHPDSCPADIAEPPDRGPIPNERPGWCEICWQKIPERRGLLYGKRGDRHLLHRGDCPPHPLNPDHSPTWTVKEDDWTGDGSGLLYDYPAGVIARVSLPNGPGEGAGWRLLADGTISIIGVVITAIVRRTSVTTVWRAATDAEAAPILTREAARLEAAGLTARARRLLALLPGTRPADATAPPDHNITDLVLTGAPTVSVPLGAARPETRIHLDGDTIWTIVPNYRPGDDWNLSNYGGTIATRHPLTPERADLIQDLARHLTDR